MQQSKKENTMKSKKIIAYFKNNAKNQLPLIIEIEADRMDNLRLSDAEVYPERDVILEERRQRVDNEPASILGEELAAAQWLHHPYRLPVIGWMHEIASYTREDCERFYETWYAPNNAALIVVGDVDAAELRPMAEAAYGGISARPVPERLRVHEPPQHAERLVTLRDPRVRQPNIIRSWLAPSLTSPGAEHGLPLEVLAQVLGGSATSRLYRSLLVEQGLAAGAGAFYRATSKDGTSFRAYASPRPAVEVDRLEPALPFLSLAMHIRGGGAADPADRAGLAYFGTGLLDEGAGPYDSMAFRREIEDHAIRLGFDADRDGVSGELKTLTTHREHAFELLRLALTEPRFDEEPAARVRGQIAAELRRLEAEPNYLASRAWFERAFPDHPYSRPTRGPPESVAAIDRDDLTTFAHRRLGRDSLVVGVAGDITADALAPLLDHAFGGLPATAE